MQTAHDILRERLLARAGIFDDSDAAQWREFRPPPTLAQIYKMQWSDTFERAMRDRMAMGYFRYGPLPKQVGRHKYDNIGSAEQRLALYKKDGNREHLVDVANLCLVEFAVHPEKPFSPQDDGVHTQLK